MQGMNMWFLILERLTYRQLYLLSKKSSWFYNSGLLIALATVGILVAGLLNGHKVILNSKELGYLSFEHVRWLVICMLTTLPALFLFFAAMSLDREVRLELQSRERRFRLRCYENGYEKLKQMKTK